MREIERVFEDPKVMAVVHDAQIVDEKLSSLDQTTFEWRNSGTGFWKNMKNEFLYRMLYGSQKIRNEKNSADPR